MTTLTGRMTLSVPEAGRLLGIGRDAAYAAAERGDIPVLKLGRSLRVPVPRLMQMLGAPHEMSEAGTPMPATATTDRPAAEEEGRDHGDTSA